MTFDLRARTESRAPTIWAEINPKTDSPLIPVGASVKMREIVTAGFANEVEAVKK